MAKTVTPSSTARATTIGQGSFENLVFRVVDLTADSSYPTGGYPFPLAEMADFASLVYVFPTMTAGRFVEYDYANSKVKFYSASNTEVAGATSLTGVVVKLFLLGVSK